MSNDYAAKVHFAGPDTLVIESGGTLQLNSGAAVTNPGGSSALDTFLTLDIADMSAEAVYYLISPIAGTISKIQAVVDGAIATADITITAAIGATGITGGVVTLPTAASAAGTLASTSPSALNAITAGAAINFTVTGGGAGGTPKGHLIVTITG